MISYKKARLYLEGIDINKTLRYKNETLLKTSSLGFALKTPSRYKKVDIREAARWVFAKRKFFANLLHE